MIGIAHWIVLGHIELLRTKNILIGLMESCNRASSELYACEYPSLSGRVCLTCSSVRLASQIGLLFPNHQSPVSENGSAQAAQIAISQLNGAMPHVR